MSHPLTIRIPTELSEWLASEAERTGVSPGKLVRDQLAEAKAEAGCKPFMQLAGRIKGPKNLSQRKGFSKASPTFQNMLGVQQLAEMTGKSLLVKKQ